MVLPVEGETHQPDLVPQSFIIKIWIEETLEEAGQALWRGHITRVPSGRRQYIRDLERLSAFIAPYLEEMGMESSEQSRQ